MFIRKEFWAVLGINMMLLVACFFRFPPFVGIMNFGSKLKANQKEQIDEQGFQSFETKLSFVEQELLIEFKRGEHFWHPQMSIWVEDLSGQYLESLFVTNSTANDSFYAGRTAENFKTFDLSSDNHGYKTRRVDALPYWSHKRGVKSSDGSYAPSGKDVDGYSGATPSGNFKLNTKISKNVREFVLLLEVNVAFDDNQYYSEYDFPDDKEYHGGTGLLGQPSLIYSVKVDLDSNQKYYIMELIGHSHHSGKNGKLYTDLSKITTAKGIVDRVIVEIK